MERIEFIKKFVVGGSILLTAPVLLNSCGKDSTSDMEDEENNNGNVVEVDLNSSSSANLQTVGGFIYVGNLIVIKSGNNSYIALSKICTHQSCDVSYNHANSNLPCPCHGSLFSTSGAVLNGPANAPLKKYTVAKTGDKLVIT